MFKPIGLFLIFCFCVKSFGFPVSRSLITDSLEVGCGWSDLAFADFAEVLREKSTMQFALKSKGLETGRRLYFFSDNSWFLTAEFFNAQSTDKDITCLIAHGAGEQSDQALDFSVKELPEWEWGTVPELWPPAQP